MDDDRKALNTLVAFFEEQIRTLLKQAIVSLGENPNPMETVLQAEIIKTITKCFNAATMLDIPPELCNTAVMDEWVQCFQRVVLYSLGELENPNGTINEEGKEKHPWWKAKINCASTLSRIFQR